MADRDRRTEHRRRNDKYNEDIRRSSKSRPAQRRESVVEEESLYRNTAKSTHTPNKRRRKSMEKDRKRTKREQRKIERRNRISRNIGIGLVAFQMVASILFAIAVLTIGMLPTRHVIVLMLLLILLCGSLLAGQIFSRKNAVAGKIVSIIMIVVLLVGAFFLFKTSGTLSMITGGDVKVDNMVVAVLDDDSAESIEDALDYSFGVQYSLGEDHTVETIEFLETEFGVTLNITEYSGMDTLATALQTGAVQAIIYNESYAGIIEDDNEDFATDIRILYEYGIVSALNLEAEAAAAIEVENETFTVYISGIDVYGSITKNSRSDVNILATINPTTGQILLTTTPRDYYVQFPGVTGDSYDKLTHAGIYGVDTSIDTLENLYDIDIDFYARVNFTSLIEMVDALGGITVNSDYAFSSDATPTGETVYFSVGENTLDGSAALAFSRERKNLTGGDNQRGINQQEVIVGMIEKAISPAIITGATGLLDSVSGNVDTNMTEAQIQNLIKMQINEMTSWNIQSISATGTDASAYCYSYSGGALYVMEPDEDSIAEIQALIQSVYDGAILSE